MLFAGYIRMVRSGGMHFCSKAIQFVPDLSSVPKFEETVANEKLPAETVDAAKYVSGTRFRFVSFALSALVLIRIMFTLSAFAYFWSIFHVLYRWLTDTCLTQES